MLIYTIHSQLKVEVYDSMYPTKRQVDYISITVNRNANAPVFSPNSYTKSVSDSYPLVTEVIGVSANDPDGVRP